MNKIINQFRRLYDDKGVNDHDFSGQEERLRKSLANLTKATDALTRSSEKLNAAALSRFATKH